MTTTTKPKEVKRHNIGNGKPCPCGFIHYVNPKRQANGMWRCAVCGRDESKYEDARQCAIDQHRARLKKPRAA